MHDGAVIVHGNKIVSAGSILPITERTNIPRRFGLRHRAAMGVAEKTDALAIIVSEETGDISMACGDEFDNKIKTTELRNKVLAKLQD